MAHSRFAPAVVFALGAFASLGQETVSAANLIEEGIELRKQGNDSAALAKFQRAFELEPTPRAQAQKALAEQALGEWVAAEKDLTAALSSQGDPWIQRNRPILGAALGTVQKHLGSLEVVSNVKGAELWLDGVLVGHLPSLPLRVLAGILVIEVKAPGYYVNRRSVEVPASGYAREALPLVRITPVEVDKGEQGVSGKAKPVSVYKLTAPRIVSFGLAGTGVAGLGVGLYQYVQLNSTRHQMDLLKSGDAFAGGTEARYAVLKSRLQAQETRAIVFSALGAAALAGGIVLYFVSGNPEPSPAVSMLSWLGAGKFEVRF